MRILTLALSLLIASSLASAVALYVSAWCFSPALTGGAFLFEATYGSPASRSRSRHSCLRPSQRGQGMTTSRRTLGDSWRKLWHN